VISPLYTAASTAEKTMLFSVSYLIHKACLMVLILCIKNENFMQLLLNYASGYCFAAAKLP